MNEASHQKVFATTLDCNETAWIDTRTMIRSVPGGYIYEYYSFGGNVTSTVFVPKSGSCGLMTIWVEKDKQ